MQCGGVTSTIKYLQGLEAGTAIYFEVRAGDHAGFVGRKEEEGISDLFRLDKTAHWCSVDAPPDVLRIFQAGRPVVGAVGSAPA